MALKGKQRHMLGFLGIIVKHSFAFVADFFGAVKLIA